MIEFHGIDKVESKKRVVVLGNFDGVHIGHQNLINQGKKLAEEKGALLTVFTFYPQWQSLNNKDFKYLLSQADKFHYFEKLGVQEVITQACDVDFSHIEAEDFVENILINQLGICGVVVGYNYSFGHMAKGTPDMLHELLDSRGITVHVEAPFLYADNVVSSSLIRHQIRAGNMSLASELLGYHYHICGEVIHGAQNGRKMDFPTANIDFDESLMLPSLGVYAAKAWLVDEPDKKYYGVLNIGTRPTVDDSPKITVEMHMIDFDQEIYGKRLYVEVHHFLRHISKFKNLSELKLTISMDVVNAKKYFSLNN